MEGSLLPLHNILPSKCTLHSSSSYVTLYPASHHTTTETSGVCASPGTMCAVVALSGSHGMFILHVCIDFITLPSGRLIEIGLDVGSTSTTGVTGSTKCPVAPASATAILTAIHIRPVLKDFIALGKPLKLLAEKHSSVCPRMSKY